MNFIKNLLTENDNITWCFARTAAALGIFAFLINAATILYKTGVVSLPDFATGYATLLAGAGAVIAAKQASSKT